MINYIKQLFDAESGTITTNDVAPAITVDVRETLVSNINSIREVLGITDLMPMSVGSKIQTYKTTKVTNPAQVAEGELIGLTQYKREPDRLLTLTLGKYRKRSTAEAIQKSGRDIAINDTDARLIKEVQKSVKSAFYGVINADTATSVDAATTLQSALAALWGRMSVFYEDIDATPVYFVNPLDIAAYLGTAQVTTQTAFGFDYIENFLGLGTVIITPAVTQGEVRGTVKENLKGAYAPVNGEVGETFGLSSDETGLVGMKHSLADDHLSIDTILACSVLFYAELTSGVFVCPFV